MFLSMLKLFSRSLILQKTSRCTTVFQHAKGQTFLRCRIGKYGNMCSPPTYRKRRNFPTPFVFYNNCVPLVFLIISFYQPRGVCIGIPLQYSPEASLFSEGNRLKKDMCMPSLWLKTRCIYFSIIEISPDQVKFMHDKSYHTITMVKYQHMFTELLCIYQPY